MSPGMPSRTKIHAIDYPLLLDASPDAIMISNEAGTIVFMNQAADALFGYNKTELLGKKIESLIPTRFQHQHVAYRQHYVKAATPRPMGRGLQLFAQHKDGHEFPVDISLGPVKTEDGCFILTILRDRSDALRKELLLAESEARWKFALESAEQGVWDWYLPEKIIRFSTTWKKILGYADDEIEDKQYTFESRMHPDDLERVRACVEEHLQQITKEYVCEARFLCKDGHYKWILDRGKVISRDADGRALRAIGTRTDITYLKEEEKQLQYFAEHDSLTGLVNRHVFEDRMTQAIFMAKRQKTLLAVCFLDLDDFKHINDTHGHNFGDLLLQAVAACMQACIREVDTLARFGGDEFALILRDIKNVTDITIPLKKVRDRFAEGFLIDNIAVKITLSIGIAVYPRDGNGGLIEKADMAMYAAKKQGKNTIIFFDTHL